MRALLPGHSYSRVRRRQLLWLVVGSALLVIYIVITVKYFSQVDFSGWFSPMNEEYLNCLTRGMRHGRRGVSVDPITFGADRAEWPKDFRMHRKVAGVINRLPCRKDPLHQIPPDMLRVRLLYIVNCYGNTQVPLMLTQLRAAAEMCEFGWTLRVVILDTESPGPIEKAVA
eukprot:RCo042193